MPDHSDNEICIEPLTFIITISLGSSRSMIFKDRISGKQILSINLNHGNILTFSKESQSKYTHGIPVLFNDTRSESFVPRISATFRYLRPLQ